MYTSDLEKLKYLVSNVKVVAPNESLLKKLMAAGGTTNSNKTIDDLEFDEEPCSIEATMKTKTIKLKPIEVEYVQWNDNLSEMKRFCQDDCKIEYLTTHIDDFWHLTVNDCLKDKWVGVAIGYYVVKLSNGFTVVSNLDFKEYFE